MWVNAPLSQVGPALYAPTLPRNPPNIHRINCCSSALAFVVLGPEDCCEASTCQVFGISNRQDRAPGFTCQSGVFRRWLCPRQPPHPSRQLSLQTAMYIALSLLTPEARGLIRGQLIGGTSRSFHMQFTCGHRYPRGIIVAVLAGCVGHHCCDLGHIATFASRLPVTPTSELAVSTTGICTPSTIAGEERVITTDTFDPFFRTRLLDGFCFSTGLGLDGFLRVGLECE